MRLLVGVREQNSQIATNYCKQIHPVTHLQTYLRWMEPNYLKHHYIIMQQDTLSANGQNTSTEKNFT